MTKFFEWEGNQEIMELLPDLGPKKRYRIFSCEMSCNDKTCKALVFSGDNYRDSKKIIAYTDSAKTVNIFGLPAPYVTSNQISLSAANTQDGLSQGKGLIVYTEETF